MAVWANFYILTGTAAATLVGLMFIAVTFGSKLVITPETQGQARTFFSPIIYHFAHAFVVACIAVVPAAGSMLLGVIAIGTSLFRIYMLPGLIKTLRHHHSNEVQISDWIQGLILPLALYGLLIASGVAMCIEGPSWAQYGVAFSVLGLVLLGIVYAWDMLVWMASK